MSYAQIDDNLPHHIKLLNSGPDAPAIFGLYVASICYAQRLRTDGRIPRNALALLLPGCPSPAPRLLKKLVELRLWEVTEDGWTVHDYLDHNASAHARRTKAKAAADARWNAHRNATEHPTEDACVMPPPLLSSPLHSTGGSPPTSPSGETAFWPDGLSTSRNGNGRIETGPERAGSIIDSDEALRAQRDRILAARGPKPS